MQQQIQKNSTYAIITLVLMATIVLPISFTFVTAQSSPIQAQSHAFLTVSPNPIGVGQQASVVMWLAEIPPFDRTGVSVDFEGFKVTVTSPDGTNQTLGPFKSDDIGAAYSKYTPTTTGTFYFPIHFPRTANQCKLNN